MVVTAMDINVTYKNSNGGNGDGYKRDNQKSKKKIRYFFFYLLNIQKKKKKITMVVTAMDINVTLNNIKKNPKLLILETQKRG